MDTALTQKFPFILDRNNLAMEVKYSGGGVLIFSYLILIHQLDDLWGFGR